MTAVESTNSPLLPVPRSAFDPDGVRVEPMAGLEWSRAIEIPGGLETATTPADIRRAWIHHAPEHRVLALYNEVRAVQADAPAPWWLRALRHGLLPSRAAGFAVEDAVADLLASRPGWVYVPWAGFGEDGYWEYVPSEITADGPVVPTTVLLTHRHSGWVDVLPAHPDGAVQPVAIDGLSGLLDMFDELESTA